MTPLASARASHSPILSPIIGESMKAIMLSIRRRASRRRWSRWSSLSRKWCRLFSQFTIFWWPILVQFTKS
jgi:uncharacterized protein with HEPN domain